MQSGGAQRLWEALDSVGIVAGDRLPRESSAVPWYVSFLLGFSGWLAALLLLAVVALLLKDTLNDGPALLVIGLLMCLGAFALSVRSNGAFSAQFALALSLAGQVAVLFGLHLMLGWGNKTVGFAMAVFELALFFAIGGGVHRVWAAAAATLALLYGIGGVEHGPVTLSVVLLATALVWFGEFRYPRYAAHFQAIGYGLVFVLFGLVAVGAMDWAAVQSTFEASDAPAGRLTGHRLTSSFWVTAVVIAVALMICFEQKIALASSGKVLLTLACLVATTALWAPGVGTGFIILILGLAHSNRILTAIGGAALLIFLGHFYYSVDLSLMYKGVALMVTGGVVLIIRYGMLWFGLLLSSEEVAPHE